MIFQCRIQILLRRYCNCFCCSMYICRCRNAKYGTKGKCCRKCTCYNPLFVVQHYLLLILRLAASFYYNNSLPLPLKLCQAKIAPAPLPHSKNASVGICRNWRFFIFSICCVLSFLSGTFCPEFFATLFMHRRALLPAHLRLHKSLSYLRHRPDLPESVSQTGSPPFFAGNA